MSAYYSERQNNTDAQVRAYIQAALDLVADLDPPSDLRELVFEQACQLYSGKQVLVQAAAPGMPNMVIPRGR